MTFFRYMSVFRYYSVDVALFYAFSLILIIYGLKKLCWRAVIGQNALKKKME